MTDHPATARQPLDWQLLAGMALALVVVLPALAALVWTPEGSAAGPLADPSPTHWLGTDAAGRDLLAALMSATLSSLLLAAFATVLCLLPGIPAGTLLALRFDAGANLPLLLSVPAAAIVAGLLIFSAGITGNVAVLVAIAGPGVPAAAYLVATSVRPALHRDFVTSARLAGLSLPQTMQRHVLPRLLPRLLAIALELLAAAMLLEIALSFAGLGMLPPGTSLGLLLRDGVQALAARSLLLLAPALVIVTELVALLLIAGRLSHAAR